VTPESEPEQLIAKAERALRGHAAHLSLDATLRKMWCDTNVRECVAAVAQARRALDAFGPRLRAAFDTALRGPVQLSLF